MAKTPWSDLDDEEKLNRLAKVLTKAGADEEFRRACLDPATGQAKIEEEAHVKFGDGLRVRCVPDQKTAEAEIVLQLPDIPAAPGTEHRAEDGLWLCTYSTYRAGSG